MKFEIFLPAGFLPFSSLMHAKLLDAFAFCQHRRLNVKINCTIKGTTAQSHELLKGLRVRLCLCNLPKPRKELWEALWVVHRHNRKQTSGKLMNELKENCQRNFSENKHRLAWPFIVLDFPWQSKGVEEWKASVRIVDRLVTNRFNFHPAGNSTTRRENFMNLISESFGGRFRTD